MQTVFFLLGATIRIVFIAVPKFVIQLSWEIVSNFWPAIIVCALALMAGAHPGLIFGLGVIVSAFIRVESHLVAIREEQIALKKYLDWWKPHREDS